MTEVGTTIRAHKIGWKGHYLVRWDACVLCGKTRWVMVRDKPNTGLCLSCSGKQCAKRASAGNLGKQRPGQSIRQRGVSNPNWRGGVVRGGNGYRYILISSDDPLFCMATTQGYVMEHRLLMARAINRPLEAWEQVHHLNGTRVDNRLENLELWKTSHSAGVREDDYHCPGCRCFEHKEEK